LARRSHSSPSSHQLCTMGRMIRERKLRKEGLTDSQGFRLRGTQVSRLEGISDAVFGLAITLIVVSLRPPVSFDELVDTLRGFVGAGACTILILQIWDRHYQYFRRYGLEDGVTRLLNGVLLFIVIAYVYPLKFLFGAFFESMFHLRATPTRMDWDQLPRLFLIYGIGYTAVYVLFGVMYAHALRKREALEFNEMETLQTRWILAEHWLLASAGALSVVIAWLGSPAVARYAWVAYFTIPIFMTVHGSMRGEAVKKLRAAIAAGGTPDGSQTDPEIQTDPLPESEPIPVRRSRRKSATLPPR